MFRALYIAGIMPPEPLLALDHSNQPIRETVDKLLNHSDDLKKAVELELQSNETGVRTTE